jgi:DNA polymerase/3'-5' exonuclease PolX
MNEKIISQFEKLIIQISNLDDASTTSNTFRVRQLKNVVSILKKYPTNITIDNYLELKKVSGIGKGSLDRIKEILTNGSLSELVDTTLTKSQIKKNNIIQELETVIGIGPKMAIKFYNASIKSVDDLKKKVEKKEIKVNEKLLLGLKYYGKFEGNIPRKEITNVYTILKSIISKFNKKEKKNSKYIFEICGSYRRQKPTSGDIDVLVSKFGDLDDEENYLENIISSLKESIKKNNDKPLLIDDLTELGHTKYMGFIKYKDNPPRRIDIRFIPYNSWFSALLYFTGSAQLNKQMRQNAKKKNLKLSEYGIFKANGEKLVINSEKDIFKILDMEYLEPQEREIQ